MSWTRDFSVYLLFALIKLSDVLVFFEPKKNLAELRIRIHLHKRVPINDDFPSNYLKQH